MTTIPERRFSFAKAALCGALASLLLASCGGKDERKEKADAAEGAVSGELRAVAPEGGFLGELDPQADTNAVFGGKITLWGGGNPKSLNMWSDLTSFNATICGLMYEPLLELHSTTDDWTGILAESWSVSDDGMEFTFRIRPQARWSDGKPVVAEDFVFFWETMMDPKNLTPVFKVGLKRLERPVAVDSLTLKVRAKERHWANFAEAAGMVAFPSHAWRGSDFNARRFAFSPTSGPYAVGEFKENRSLRMDRRADWWGRALNWNRGKYNFDRIVYKFSEDRVKALEALKKGDWDLYPLYTASIWARQTDFDAVKKGWVAKTRVFNESPVGFQGLAINSRRAKFADARVRRALGMLMNRAEMNAKLMFDQYFLLDSYFPGLWPNRDNPDAEPLPYAPDSARRLLAEAGWTPDARGALRDAEGNPFQISILHSGEDTRHLEIYLQDLKAAGIDASIERMSYASTRKRMDELDFDLHWINWGAGRQNDPEGLWHSSTANEQGTNNLAGVADPEIDSLIEAQKGEFDAAKRRAILKKIDARLLELCPYVLLWQNGSHRLLHWNRFGMPKNPLARFGDPDAVIVYWWYDRDRARALDAARKSGEPLPAAPADVVYGD